ncbi:30S ribosomal protein S19 [Candidatus Woesearchaeota archaeon]|nr:30S ribosomal protein S19 [Candidatus Woesearchaeota archaeon]
MAKDFTYRGKTLDELKKMSITELKSLLPSRARRNINRGFNEGQKIFLKKIEKAISGQLKKPVKTHCRDMIVFPNMVGLLLLVYNGKSYEKVMIDPDMVGHYLGEFSHTRKRVQHNAPGIGATKSTSSVSVK